MAILEQILRFIFSYIDSIIAWVISLLYDLFMELANLMIYSEKIVDTIGQRIGLILGIFMLFRIAISLIEYLISPDKTKDNNKGGGKLLTNIIISLVLLATINIIFVQAYKIQRVIISSNFLPKIFFGAQADVPNIDIGYYAYTAFFAPNEDVLGEDCNSLWDATIQINNECVENLRNSGLDDSEIKTISNAKNTLNMSKVFNDQTLVTAKKNNQFIFKYYPIVSNIVGIVICLMLLSYSIDLAVRAIKLLFLQIIAPIPIISKMDPGKGQEIFKKWYQETFKTYLVLFIRILIINFVLYMITIIKTEFKDIFDNSLFLNIFLIIGCLIFAKQVPKLIEDMFGIKMDGMTLHPFKKIEENALFGKQVAGLARVAAAGTVGIGAGALGAGVASAALGNKWWQTAGATLRGGLRGAVGSMVGGYKGKNIFQAVGTGFGARKRNAEYVNKLDGTTLAGRLRAGHQQFWNMKTDADTTKLQLDDLGKFGSSIDSLLKRSEAESVKHNDLEITRNGETISMQQHKQRQEMLNQLRNTQLNREDYYRDVEVEDIEEVRKDEAKYGSRDPNKNYMKIERQFDQAAFDNAQATRNSNIQELSDQIAKDTKMFATEYATQVSQGRYAEDTETRAYIDVVQQSREDLTKYFNEEQMENFNIFENGHFSGAAAKQAKANSDTAKYRIENVKNIKQGNKYVNEYEQQKANAAATKPKGK